LRILATEMRDDFVRFVGLTREVASMFKATTVTLKDLQLSKEPEVELLARTIYANMPKAINAEASFDLAAGWIKARDGRRNALALATPK
jgi:hypothetical protein